jgi:hypothetical protein
MTSAEASDEAEVDSTIETGGDGEDDDDCRSGNDCVIPSNAVDTGVWDSDVHGSTGPASVAISNAGSTTSMNQRNQQHPVFVRKGPRGRIITEDQKLQRRLLANRKSAAASRTRRLDLIEQLKKTVLELSTRVDQLQSENYELRLRLSTGALQEVIGGPSSSTLQHPPHPLVRPNSFPIVAVTPHPPLPLPPNIGPKQTNCHLPLATTDGTSPPSSTVCNTTTQPLTHVQQQHHQELQYRNNPSSYAANNVLVDTQQHHQYPLVGLDMHGYIPPPPPLLCDGSIMPFSFNTSMAAYPTVPLAVIGTANTTNETNTNVLRQTTSSSIPSYVLHPGGNHTTYETSSVPQHSILPHHTLNSFPVEQNLCRPDDK